METEEIKNVLKTLEENSKMKSELQMNAIRSGNVEMFKDILKLSSSVSSEAEKEAIELGDDNILNMIFEDSMKTTDEAKKKKMKTDIESGKADIFQLIPRDTEYDYTSKEKADKVNTLLKTGEFLPYEEVLEKLVVPEAHVGRKDKGIGEWKKCPSGCGQTDSCGQLREVFHLVEIIKTELGKIDHPVFGKIFSGLDMTLIGSMKEGTKLFRNEEMDLHLSLQSTFLNKTRFDAQTQELYVNDQIFPCQEFVQFYMESLKHVLNKIELPKTFSMLPLKTSYSPCLRCMKITNGRVQTYRCHHQPDCEIHSNSKCEDMQDCPHECDCKSFTSPSLGWSKIGAVLHLGKILNKG